MNKDSEFLSKIVSYLESMHVGEFQTGTHEQVKYNVDIAQVDRKYIDPTKVLPTSPIKKCNDKNCMGCIKCDANNKWWSEYFTTVDDILLKSNMHTCRGEKIYEKTKQIKNKSKSKKEKLENKSDDIPVPVTGCLSNKYGICKARFPRQIVSETMVDPETGALLMKKHEQWMNTVTPMVTYLLRCNSDVTSLLSGTAIKAVIAYISDYITKSSLKTYMLFDVILDVFDKNSEYLDGKTKRQEKARKLITQVVNSLTGKLEIGGPMACMYLLGNPDHYTNVQFKTFYWRSFVREVRQAWNIDTDESPDKIAMITNQGNIVGLSNTSDYQHRPPVFIDMNLYDWICLATKQKRKQKIAKNIDKEIFRGRESIDDEDDELDIIGDSTSEDIYLLNDRDNEYDTNDGWLVDDNDTIIENIDTKIGDKLYDTCTDSDDDELNLKDGKLTIEQDDKWHSFLSSHPQFATHQVTICSPNKAKIPDFIGGALPRSDKGDRDYYCSVMLTLFKPWRTGMDLKVEDQSWDDAFSEFKFTDHQKRLMLYFNLRYDCLDARDDFASQRDQIYNDNNNSNPYSQKMTDNLDQLMDEKQTIFNEDSCVDSHDIDEPGPQGKNDLVRKRNMQEIENIITHTGWLDKCTDGILETINTDPVISKVYKDSATWRKEVLVKKKEAIDKKRQHMKSTIMKEDDSEEKKKFTAYDTAEIIDMSYLFKDFHADEQSTQDIIDITVNEFKLNTEQERAFRIIANHASSRSKQQLKMYLGGMGGTGKSQVIKALKRFFEKRNEAHRMIILAPTGTAAAIVGGFTYHSILGINERMSGKPSEYEKIRENLRGVEYIFIDEVSMISCHDLYKISSQLAKAYNKFEEPFGGFNMIFAGDFAQLPPAMNKPSLYSRNVHTQIQARMGVKQQEAVIGKALWHQFTTAVILRQNMRQKSQSEEDAKFRTALENLRFRACTEDDIKFLRTRVTGKGPNKPKLSSKRFKNVSIITAWNAHKDAINQLGSKKFAEDSNQVLTDFYSIDTLSESMPNAKECKPGSRAEKIFNAGIITSKLQQELWNLPPAATDHIPGKLSLCIGLPVMIRHNDATELCITKGQEGFVAGWITIQGPDNQVCLETLFVRLSNPPSNVQFEGLPENVVPLTAMSQTVKCYLSDDTIIKINRKQINIPPNFSMTDYASQGKTRPNNPVHVNNCNGHQAVYTCLSRSSTAAGTIIVQAFSDSLITGGCTGYLRQEFRELELLDEITALNYEKKIPSEIDISGPYRSVLIQKYRKWKGVEYVPKNTHPAIAWSITQPFPLDPVIKNAEWKLVDKSANATSKKDKSVDLSVYVPAINSNKIEKNSGKKHKADNDISEQHLSKKIKFNKETNINKDKQNEITNNKKRKFSEMDSKLSNKKTKVESSDIDSSSPVGLMWDSQNFSCAYDSLFTILYHIWSSDPIKWSKFFNQTSQSFSILSDGFTMYNQNLISIENSRDNVRYYLHNKNSTLFPNGPVGMNITDLAYLLCKPSEPICKSNYECTNCNISAETTNNFTYYIDLQRSDLNITNTDSIVSILTRLFNKPTSNRCVNCNNILYKNSEYFTAPELLICHLPYTDVKINKSFIFCNKRYKLKGVVYYGSNHYTSCIILENNSIWYHDGIQTGSSMILEGNISSKTRWNKHNDKNAVLFIYICT